MKKLSHGDQELKFRQNHLAFPDLFLPSNLLQAVIQKMEATGSIGPKKLSKVAAKLGFEVSEELLSAARAAVSSRRKGG